MAVRQVGNYFNESYNLSPGSAQYNTTQYHLLTRAPFILLLYLQARALYDFDAEPGTGEISIRVGDLLTVTRTDVGEGWWEGSTTAGQSGLFPEAYVEEIPVEDSTHGPPAMAPPPLPPDYGAGGGWNTPSAAQAVSGGVSDDWGDPWGGGGGGGGGGVAPAQQPPQQDWQADVSTEVL